MGPKTGGCTHPGILKLQKAWWKPWITALSPKITHTTLVSVRGFNTPSLGDIMVPSSAALLGARETLLRLHPKCFLLLQTDRPQSRESDTQPGLGRPGRRGIFWGWEPCPGLAALGAPVACARTWFLLSEVFRAQGLIGSRWWAVMLAGQVWGPKDEPRGQEFI